MPMGRRWLLFGLAALIASCDGSRPITARPALYEVRDADTVIWLFGTVHVLPAGVAWEGTRIADAERRADTLVTELPAIDPDRAAATFERIGHADGLPPILGRVAPAQRAALRQIADRTSVPIARLDAMKSWAAALTLTAAAARTDAAATTDNGVEATIAAHFAGKPRLGFETLDQQLGFFDALSEEDQRRLLAASLNGGTDFEATLGAWGAGDEARIAAIVNAPLARAPAIRAALLTMRNARWADWIARRMSRPGRIFVAVGAGHLAGPDSVVARLRAAGLSVRRVQ